MRVTVLNTEQELKFFPLTQSIKLKIDSLIEKNNIKDSVFLIRNQNRTGLFNFSNRYNQSIGYIKEKFDAEEINISLKEDEGTTLLTVTPIKPLSPGFEYTLIISKQLSKPFLNISKPISKSSSDISLSTFNTQKFDFSLEILSSPSITANSNVVNAVLTDNLSSNKTTIILDLKKDKTYSYNGIYTFNFNSNVYLKGELFNISSSGMDTNNDDFFLLLKSNITEYIKPIENENKSLSTTDLLNNINSTVNKPIVKTPTQTVTYLHNNIIRVTLENIKTSDLDFDGLTEKHYEAFHMYTLSSLGLYDNSLTYNINIEVEDDYNFLVVVEKQ